MKTLIPLKNSNVAALFVDLELSIDGEKQNIPSSSSAISINNKIYYSEDILKDILEKDHIVTIQDGVLSVEKK